jgi:D-amino-acid dehydrogenase
VSAKRVAVIGGGVIGLCSAHSLRQAGYEVTVIERGTPTHDSCSLGNAGMVTPSHFVPLAAPGMVAVGLKMMWNPRSPFYIRPRLNGDLMRWAWGFVRAANAAHVERSAPLLRDLLTASREAFNELYETMQAQPETDFGLVKRGLLMLCKTRERLHEETEMAEMAHRLGMPADVLTPEQAAELDPNITMDIVGAVFFPQDCHLIPQKFITGIERELDKLGVHWQWQTEVKGWRTEGSRIAAVQTTRGEIAADEFVLAGGSWSSGTVKPLGLRLPLQPGKGYSLSLKNPRQMPSLCSICTEARVAVTPMGDTLRFAGTMEIAGMNTDINPKRIEGILAAIPRYFPEFRKDDFQTTPAWSGLRPCSPDGLPYLGRTAKFGNLVVATGHAMMGLSLGPVTGRLVSEIISGQKPFLDIAPLSPDRYA